MRSGGRAVGLVLVALTFLWGATEPVAALEQPPPPPPVTAAGAVLWDPADQRVLFGRDETVPRPMASTTKIMTVLLALEAGAADEPLTVSVRAEQVGRIPGGATLGLEAGDVLPARNALAALMLRSGNDAAVAVAEHVAGSEAAFVELMNRRAAELGLNDTSFVNASGLTDELDHHASPLDLARLAEVAMDDEQFAAWAGASRLDVPGIGTVANRNLLLETFEGATGVKTGYTDLAGLCLVASATRGPRTLYAVVLGSEDSFADAAALLEYGFTAYRRVGAFAPDTVAGRYRWAHGDVALVAADALASTVPVASSVRLRTVLEPRVAPPVAVGDVLGEAHLVVEGAVVASTPLRAAADVQPAPARQPSVEVGAALQDAVRTYLRLQPVEREA